MFDFKFKFIEIARAIAALKTAVGEKSLPAIETAAVALADLVGFGREATALAAVIDAAAAGSLTGTLRAAGEFLIAVATAIAGPVVMFAVGGTDDAAPADQEGDGAKLACVAECCRTAAFACAEAAAV